ncbi:unnamed protein product (macronuclear) [Paramecium tetraurelia]|uniref:PHR domain-containing protein n=1 Tax=Paramecium tetraurelia TaxID=5888 RepID=A0DVU8_PARTE|nr:uncharacterized protein GSPATT00020818001 [Paramecium tetraurelia]CAK87165.1 unnamed protein product [Paramecium tetraurelia]|eukprot:XP_001454562.1 hypothetical protein (macronuclear) [Paramecium tetraurelia strain d4-2]
MKYLSQKLCIADQQQLDKAIQLISKIRIQVNQRLNDLEKMIYDKIQDLQENEIFKQLNQMETLFIESNDRNFDQKSTDLFQMISSFSNCKENKISHNNVEQLDILNFQQAIKKLMELQISNQYMMNNITNLVDQNKKDNKKPVNSGPQNASNEIWKHKTFAKSNDRKVAFNFTKNCGVAENILPLQNVVLSGFLLTQLFSGQNQFDQNINDKDKEVVVLFRVHEGLDLSISVYDEIINIKHSNLKIINDCYFIELEQDVFLKKGMTYSLSLVSQINETFNLYMFAGKSVNFGEIKFLNKETENIIQSVQVKQSLTQSCIPGIVIHNS